MWTFLNQKTLIDNFKKVKNNNKMIKGNEKNAVDIQSTGLKKKYVNPQIRALLIEMEEGVASGSASPASMGGRDGSASPGILDQSFEEKNYDFEF